MSVVSLDSNVRNFRLNGDDILIPFECEAQMTEKETLNFIARWFSVHPH